MRNLGMCANFFINHVYYYGDQHYDTVLGPERANQVNPCGAALRESVSFSLHSDPPVTPLGHLFTMWCAVNRVTASGRVLGEHEKISAYDALKAATIDAAYQIHMDHQIGSLEIGKLADFAVLDESPLDVEPLAIKDIPVWGTMLGGKKFPVVKG
jgi:predicted amidohydrolase YtcJ